MLCPTCFKDQCNHKTEKFHCDDLMVYPVQRLNELGYKTLFCCAGHIAGSTDKPSAENLQIYILFKKMYDFSIDPPMGFEFRHNSWHNSWALECAKPIITGDFESQYSTYINAHANLHNWLLYLKPWNKKLHNPNRKGLHRP
jgi:hypothetical protein